MALTTSNDDDVMSTINITPFTDVLLVLLIIFIILTAVVKDPRLPEAKNTRQVLASQIVVAIDAHNRIELGSHVVALADLDQAFRDLTAQTGHRLKTCIIKANPAADFGTVLRVMDAAKNADITGFGLANRVAGSKDTGTP